MNIKTDLQNGILHIVINRPQSMNALNIELLKELKVAVAEVYDNDEVKGALLYGEGEKAFAAGADIAEFANFSDRKARNMSRNGHNIFNSIEACPKPFIAVVNGFALGGGCELAIACHLRVATENAKFGLPEVGLGVIPGYGGTQRLIQLIGKGKALELLMTGNMVKADEAVNLGLANYALPTKDEAIEKASSLISKISTKAPLSIAKVIACANEHFRPGTDGFAYEVDQFAKCFATEDIKEGTQAFLEKRKPEFKGK